MSGNLTKYGSTMKTELGASQEFLKTSTKEVLMTNLKTHSPITNIKPMPLAQNFGILLKHARVKAKNSPNNTSNMPSA